MGNNQSNSNLFGDLAELGFNNMDGIDLYGNQAKKTEEKAVQETQVHNDKNALYDKEVICPVCENRFNARAVKVSSSRISKKDSDFFILYSGSNPYFYDVWLCNSCGYAAMKKDFEFVKEHQKEDIKKNITSRWRGRSYPDVYDVDIAIERYKLSLLNYVVIGAKNSSKAMNCLKIAWMYRLKEDYENETAFLKQALEGFENAFFNEDFPIYGMDRFTTMYLVGELSRRVGLTDKAMQWFSRVITTPSVSPKIKEMARDQKDLIKEEEQQAQQDLTDINAPNNSEDEKKGFFKSLFKR